MWRSARTGAVLVALLAASAACGDPEYPLLFVNDLSQAVIVEGCKDCADGRKVEPDQSVSLTVEQDVTVRVTKADGTVVGCGYTTDGASTSDVVPTKASFFENLLCDTPPGQKRSDAPAPS